MTLERISAFITYCIAVVLAWLGDLSIKDASTLGGLMIGVLMLAINWYYKHKAYQLLRDGQIPRISSPALTAQEIAEMDPADLTAMSVEVVTFLLKKSVLAGLPTA